MNVLYGLTQAVRGVWNFLNLPLISTVLGGVVAALISARCAPPPRSTAAAVESSPVSSSLFGATAVNRSESHRTVKISRTTRSVRARESDAAGFESVLGLVMGLCAIGALARWWEFVEYAIPLLLFCWTVVVILGRSRYPFAFGGDLLCGAVIFSGLMCASALLGLVSRAGGVPNIQDAQHALKGVGVLDWPAALISGIGLWGALGLALRGFALVILFLVFTRLAGRVIGGWLVPETTSTAIGDLRATLASALTGGRPFTVAACAGVCIAAALLTLMASPLSAWYIHHFQMK